MKVKRIMMFTLATIEFILMIDIIIVNSLRIADGSYISGNYTDGNEVAFATFKLTSVVLYFIISLILYISHNKNNIINKNGTLVLYLFTIIIADIFFSIFKNSIGGMIIFLICYLFIAGFIYSHYVEIIIRCGLLIIGIVVMLIINKLTFFNFIVVTIGETLLVSLIVSWIKYRKDKNILNLSIALAISLASISDTTIVLRTLITNPKIINDISSLLIWPTYMLANFFLVLYIYKNRENYVQNELE